MTTPTFRLRKIDIALTALLGLAIAVVTLLPPQDLPKTDVSDKLEHFIAFAAFAFPVSLKRPRWAWAIFLIALGFGGLIEMIQPYMHRSRDIADFWADAAGASFGVALGLILTSLPRLRLG